MTNLELAFDISFSDLYEKDGIDKIDAIFLKWLCKHNPSSPQELLNARKTPPDARSESDIITGLAIHLEDFIAELFGIKKEVDELKKNHDKFINIYRCKRDFVQRRIAKLCRGDNAGEYDIERIEKELEEFLGGNLSEISFSKNVLSWEKDKTTNEDKILVAAQYANWALNTEPGREKYRDSVLFTKPAKLDFENLVPVERAEKDGITSLRLADNHELRTRDGFKLTDPVCDLKTALGETNYCIFCHNQEKDSCSKGLREKPNVETGETPFKTSPTKVMQAGCPLEEKISEMNALKTNGCSIGALAVVTIDNPLCAATGHRICNDCLKACIYQKQDPVNIPKAETRVLQDILDLPWGFEIYGLLTRWNPLNLRKALPKKDSGYKVLIAGLGPAGYSLAHHLLNEGHTVVGIDGLKIEPLPEDISGVTILGDRVDFKPIRNINDLFEELDERTLAGFGGVAEYGITVRWNKNYLKVIRLLLERRKNFAMYGGVRFGSTITYDSAFEMGFDHIALALGAGKPTIVSIPNAMARGVRTASDFLMSLQLTGSGKKNSIANLQVRLPVVVIGGGLTAIDAATESLAYYPVQVEKFLNRYEILVKELGENAVRKNWSNEETIIANEFMAHAKELRDEKEKTNPDVIALLKKWGGAKIAYRRRFIDSPAYRLNHEEVEKALEEGIEFIENVTPSGVRVDEFQHASGLRVNYNFIAEDERIEIRETTLPAKTIFMAAGTSPNTVIAREDKKHFSLDGKYFTAIDVEGNSVTPETDISKPKKVHVLMSKNDDGKFVSFFGDLHPTFAGNVVKALGSTKQGYPIVSEALMRVNPANAIKTSEFFNSLNENLRPTVHEIIRLTPTIIEVVIKAPLAAKEFQPGQFYRLQNFEKNAIQVTENQQTTSLAMEGLALTGAWVDKEKGLLSLIVLEMGGSSNLCAHLKKGEPVSLMGPTGAATHILAGETVMLIGGGLGNAVLFSIGKALKEAGSKVLYFAGYKKQEDRYKVKDIEAASDIIIWCCDEGSFEPEREGDKSFSGNIVQAIIAYAKGELGDVPINVEDVDRMVVIGSDRMMAAVTSARHAELRDFLKPEHIAVGSINSPMQCMMKEICAQCLQKHVDPETGERTHVYSCSNQDQCLDKVNFPHLSERLKQNGVQEKLTSLWIARSLSIVI